MDLRDLDDELAAVPLDIDALSVGAAVVLILALTEHVRQHRNDDHQTELELPIAVFEVRRGAVRRVG